MTLVAQGFRIDDPQYGKMVQVFFDKKDVLDGLRPVHDEFCILDPALEQKIREVPRICLCLRASVRVGHDPTGDALPVAPPGLEHSGASLRNAHNRLDVLRWQSSIVLGGIPPLVSPIRTCFIYCNDWLHRG
jgi:hypothetical protein